MNKLITLFVLAISCLSLSSCSSGVKAYNVKSETQEGQAFIQQYGVLYAVESHVSILGADFYEGKGTYVVPNNGNYAPLKQEYVSQFNLQPKYHIWQSYGWIVVLVVGLFLFLRFGIYFIPL